MRSEQKTEIGLAEEKARGDDKEKAVQRLAPPSEKKDKRVLSPARPRVEARLPSGVAVELLGHLGEPVERPSMSGGQDGSPLEKRPYESMGAVLNYKGSITRELASPA